MSTIPNETTIVTAFDEKFLWGGYLLLASLKRYGVDLPLIVVTKSLPPELRRLFDQFYEKDRIRFIEVDNESILKTMKPVGLLAAETPQMAWLDADCFVFGDIRPQLHTGDGDMQVRFRGFEENKLRFRKKYASGENGGIPKSTLKTWKKDVNDRENSAIDATCVTNAIVFSENARDFIQLWKDQMGIVNPKHAKHTESAYRYGGGPSDELVFNSLLAFSSLAPKSIDYQLDKTEAIVGHFGVDPKPWNRWQYSHLRFFDHTMDLIDWASEHYETPPIPPSLTRTRRKSIFLGSRLRSYVHR